MNTVTDDRDYGVQCVVLHRKQRFVLLGLRVDTTDSGRWALPGGHVEPGESTLGAARRELQEETGLVGLSADVLPAFVTWDTPVPFAHFPVIFTDVYGEATLQTGEKFSALGYFPLDELPRPLLSSSEQILIMLGETRVDGAFVGRAQGFMQVQMLALHSGMRQNAAWTLRAYFDGVGENGNELVITWGRRTHKARNLRVENFVEKDGAVARIRELVAKRLRRGYEVVGVEGMSPAAAMELMPSVSLNVVSASLLRRLAENAEARAAFLDEDPDGLMSSFREAGAVDKSSNPETLF